MCMRHPSLPLFELEDELFFTFYETLLSPSSPLPSPDLSERYYACFEGTPEKEATNVGQKLILVEVSPLNRQSSETEMALGGIGVTDKAVNTPLDALPYTKNLVVALWENNLCIRPIPYKGKVGGKGTKSNNLKSRELKNLLATWENEAKLAKQRVDEGLEVAL